MRREITRAATKSTRQLFSAQASKFINTGGLIRRSQGKIGTNTRAADSQMRERQRECIINGSSWIPLEIHNDSKSHIFFKFYFSLWLGLACEERERPLLRTGISIDLYLFPSGWGGERTNGRGELRTERYWRNGQTSSLACFFLLLVLVVVVVGVVEWVSFLWPWPFLPGWAGEIERAPAKTTMGVLCVLLHAISQSSAV